jgi:ubiquitin C-terminal hydrolase
MGSCVGRRTEVQVNAIIPSNNFGQNNALLDRWSEQQVKLLNKRFNEYKSTEGLDFDGFLKLFKDASYLPKSVVHACFTLFAIPSFQVLNFRGFCVMVAQIFLSSKREKAELIFKLFASDSADQWSEKDKTLFSSSYKSFQHSSSVSEKQYDGNGKRADFVDWAVRSLDFLFILRPFELIPSPAQEKSIVLRLMDETKAKEGSSFCLLATQWWEAWKNYVSFSRGPELALSQNRSINIGDRPVAIDNSVLLTADSELRLRTSLKRDKDFVLLPLAAWEVLHEWYDGGPKLIRKFIMHNRTLVLELYPPILTVIPVLGNGYPSNSTSVVLLFSQTNRFAEVVEQAAKALSRPANSSRIWVKSKGVWLTPQANETLENVKLMEDEVLLETYVADKLRGFWPRDLVKDRMSVFPSSTMTASSSNSEDSKRSDGRRMTYSRAVKSPGVVGLLNLGNTCYFNCIIQALVHTPLLQEFFVTSNVLSFLHRATAVEDALALELAGLSKEMWTGSHSRVSPGRLFKLFTARFPMFEDKEQHDCHEFLSLFLDALHEELRREGEGEGKSTVILENPESKQIEIAESDKQWQLLQGTQGSIVTDICAGQTKTTLQCTACNSRRILFEIFTNLSLPIPIATTVPVYVTVVPLAAAVVKIGLVLQKEAKVKDLLDQIAGISKIAVQSLTVIEADQSCSISVIDAHPNSSLEGVGVCARSELYAFESRKTIESCEALGRRATKPVQDYEITAGSQVDVQQGEKWTSGRVLEVKKRFITEYLIDFDYESLQMWRSSSQVGLFRSRTSDAGCAVQQVTLIQVSSSRKVLSFPILLSIGNWYTFDDLHRLASEQTLRLVGRDLKSSDRPFRLLVLDPVSLRCGLCRGYASCPGCALERSRTELRSQSFRRVCIAAEWPEGAFCENIRHDNTVAAVKEKEKELIRNIDINMCLDEFTREEKLEMECAQCKNNNMKMKMEIWRAPDILILSFKRFTYANGTAEKINQLVSYPFSGFEIAQFVKGVEGNAKSTMATSAALNSYDLYAVVMHTGNIHSGHYTTMVKMPSNWVLFDDESSLELKEPPETSSLVSTSYLLFYRRRRFSSSNVINLTYNSL